MWFSRWISSALGFACIVSVTAARADARDSGASALLGQISQSAVNVRIALREARGKNDVFRARCVSKKLDEVHAQQRIAEEHAGLLRAAQTRSGVRMHHHVLEMANERARELAHEARRCGGSSEPELRVIPPHGSESRVAKR